MKYVNIGLTAGKSEFAGVRSDGAVDNLNFVSKAAIVNTQQGSVRMCAGHVSLTKPFTVDCGDTCTAAFLNESIKVQWNVKYADEASFAALETEVLRVLADARAEYNLLNGIVPPASATFQSE